MGTPRSPKTRSKKIVGFRATAPLKTQSKLLIPLDR